jgi:hypothetical protein
MLLSIHLCIYFFIQTLTTLCLRENQIGDKGAQHLAIALQQNKVTWVRLCFFVFTIHSLFTQTLTVLNLGWNQIGNKGAQHLSIFLQQNKVNHLDCAYSYSFIHLLFHTDPHHIEPLRKWDRSWGSTIFSQCSATK